MAAIDLQFRPREWQADCFRALRRFSVIVVHRRGGKTVMSVMKLIDAALRIDRPDARYAYIAPQLKQAKAIAWSYLKHYATKVPDTSVNESELWVQFPNGARIRIYGADNPDSLRGLYFDGVVMDEVAQMKPDVWGEIVRPALADRSGWALFIGTPKGINLFSELYLRAVNDSEWFARSFTCHDTDALPDSEIQQMRSEMSENQFRQEMLCDFSASSDDVLMSIDLVEEAARRVIREDAYAYAAKVLGVDVAGEGADKTVLTGRQGLCTFKPVAVDGLDQLRIAERVASAIRKFQPDMTFVDDTGGYGGGVVARLRELGFSVVGVNFASKPANARFANKRAEMYWLLAEWMRAGGVIPNLPELKVDLCAVTGNTNNPRGVMQLCPKDDIKDAIGRSPDWGDSLALTFAMPVAPRLNERGLPIRHGARADVEYDPIEGVRQQPTFAMAATEYDPFR